MFLTSYVKLNDFFGECKYSSKYIIKLRANFIKN